MKKATSILLFLCTFIAAGAFAAESTKPLRPVNTFSIVARDPATGEMGAAVQSHWFSVGSIVIWAEPGVGAVATQSFVEPSYGPLGLELMRTGKTHCIGLITDLHGIDLDNYVFARVSQGVEEGLDMGLEVTAAPPGDVRE